MLAPLKIPNKIPDYGYTNLDSRKQSGGIFWLDTSSAAFAPGFPFLPCFQVWIFWQIPTTFQTNWICHLRRWVTGSRGSPYIIFSTKVTNVPKHTNRQFGLELKFVAHAFKCWNIIIAYFSLIFWCVHPVSDRQRWCLLPDFFIISSRLNTLPGLVCK